MAGFKSQEKRRRELAKLDKRRAKDVKRALRRAERSGSPASVIAAAAPPAASPAKPAVAKRQFAAPAAVPSNKPLTLAEAVERWKSTKIIKAKPQR